MTCLHWRRSRWVRRSGHIISEVPSSFKVLYNMISLRWSALKGSKNQRKVNNLAKYKEKMSGKTKRKPSTQPGGRDTGKTSLGKTLLSWVLQEKEEVDRGKQKEHHAEGPCSCGRVLGELGDPEKPQKSKDGSARVINLGAEVEEEWM